MLGQKCKPASDCYMGKPDEGLLSMLFLSTNKFVLFIIYSLFWIRLKNYVHPSSSKTNEMKTLNRLLHEGKPDEGLISIQFHLTSLFLFLQFVKYFESSPVNLYIPGYQITVVRKYISLSFHVHVCDLDLC